MDFSMRSNLKRGKKKWAFKTEMAIEAPPLLYGGQVIVGSTDGFLYSIGQKSGKLTWKYETMGEIMGAANQAIRPISKDDVLVVGSYDNFVHCVETKSENLFGSLKPRIISMVFPQSTIKRMSSLVDAMQCYMSLDWKMAKASAPLKWKPRLQRQ